MTRTTKVHKTVTSTGSPAFQYFGYQDGVAVHQSTKLWRYRADAARAARRWEKGV